MRKVYSLFAAVILAATFSAQSTTVTYTFSGTDATEVRSGTIDANASFVSVKASAPQYPTYYTAAPAALRIYSHEADSDGNSIIITIDPMYVITNLEFTATDKKYAPNVTYGVDGGTLAPMSMSNLKYAASGLTGQQVKFKNADFNGATEKELRIPSFTITYRLKATMAVVDVNGTKNKLVKNTNVSNSIMFSGKSEIKILNMSGQVVKTAVVNENTPLNVSSLPAGMYIVTGSVNGKVVSQKIMKN